MGVTGRLLWVELVGGLGTRLNVGTLQLQSSNYRVTFSSSRHLTAVYAIPST